MKHFGKNVKKYKLRFIFILEVKNRLRQYMSWGCLIYVIYNLGNR